MVAGACFRVIARPVSNSKYRSTPSPEVTVSANPMRQWPPTHGGEPRRKRGADGAADDVVPCGRHDFAPAPSRRRSSVSKGVAQRTAPGALGWCTRMQRFATRSIGTLYTNKGGRKRTDVSDPGLERGALHVYDRLGSTDADQLARLRYAGATGTRISVFGYSSPSSDVNGRVRDSASKANHGTFGSHGLWRGRRCPGVFELQHQIPPQ